MFSDLKLIILDRDGVINYDSAEYIKSADEWIPIPGSISAIAQLNKAGLFVAIATNQSGIGRGYYSEQALHDMHKKMQQLLEQENGKIDAIRFCPHAPENNCLCRKPNSAMIKDLLEFFEVTPAQTLVIGDAWRDIQAALSEGCHAALVLTGKGEATQKTHAHELNKIYHFQNLQEAANKIINNHNADRPITR